MFITPKTLTKAAVNFGSDFVGERHLRIRYIGTKSESICDPINISVDPGTPPPPTISLDKDSIVPGQYVTATIVIPDLTKYKTNFSEAYWRLYSDPYGQNRIDKQVLDGSGLSEIKVPQLHYMKITDPKIAIYDDFINMPSGEYYASAKYVTMNNKGVYNQSDWSDLYKITWTNLNLPNSYYQKQAAAYDLIKEVATECWNAKTPSIYTSDDTAFDVHFNQIKLFESWIDTSRLEFRVSGSRITAINDSPVKLSCPLYGDTFAGYIDSVDTLDGRKKGCFVRPDDSEIYFDMDKSNSKFVVSYTNERGEKYWIGFAGYYSDKIGRGCEVYGIKANSTIRRNVTINLDY